jgi:hypothetical protein
MRRAVWVLLLAGCGGTEEVPLPEEAAYWVRNCARHGFNPVETAQATGLEVPQLARLDVRAAPPPPFAILPYPGGRHPRIGFLEGAVNPHRDTKFSLFLPGGGYAVVDFPEALWADGELQYLAHTHIPTVWEKKGVLLPRMDWTRDGDALEARRILPDGLAFYARVSPDADGATMLLKLRNDGDRKRTGLRVQVCVLLKAATGFAQQTRDNKKHLPGAVCAARSSEAPRWIAVRFERAKTWDNPPCPCIHSDPSFPDLAPGEEAAVRGRVWLHEGENPPTPK